MKSKTASYALAVAVSVVFCAERIVSADDALRAIVTFCVLDETGAPITNAWVRGTGYWQPAKSEGATGHDGCFTYEDRVVRDIGCRVAKPGYYDTHGEVWPGPRTSGDRPTNMFVVTLKKIINPVPMEYRRIVTDLPTLGVPVAFDLGDGDWVAPHGKGVECDVWLTGERVGLSRRDHDVRVTLVFSNCVDGIQAFAARHPSRMQLASDLMPPQVAPPTGYTNSITLWQSWHQGKPMASSRQADRNYLFRVRTRVDNTGAVVQANVGWIEEDFAVDPGSGPTILLMFKYYFNPDPHSCSLEPKPKH